MHLTALKVEEQKDSAHLVEACSWNAVVDFASVSHLLRKSWLWQDCKWMGLYMEALQWTACSVNEIIVLFGVSTVYKLYKKSTEYRLSESKVIYVMQALDLLPDFCLCQSWLPIPKFAAHLEIERLLINWVQIGLSIEAEILSIYMSICLSVYHIICETNSLASSSFLSCLGNPGLANRLYDYNTLTFLIGRHCFFPLSS